MSIKFSGPPVTFLFSFLKKLFSLKKTYSFKKNGFFIQKKNGFSPLVRMRIKMAQTLLRRIFPVSVPPAPPPCTDGLISSCLLPSIPEWSCMTPTPGSTTSSTPGTPPTTTPEVPGAAIRCALGPIPRAGSHTIRSYHMIFMLRCTKQTNLLKPFAVAPRLGMTPRHCIIFRRSMSDPGWLWCIVKADLCFVTKGKWVTFGREQC